MLPEMTPAVSRAIQWARFRAVSSAVGKVRPEDLLYGLVEEEDGIAAVILKRAGTNFEAVADYLAIPVALGERELPLPLDQSCLVIFDQATELAVQWTAEHTVSSDALLVALLRHDTELRQQLVSCGLQWDRLEAQLPPTIKHPLQVDELLFINEPTERIELARILDASANRAREALRVVEDYCRFALDDEFLTREAKQLRHDLAAALAELPVQLLLEARETQSDVGTQIRAFSQQSRHSLRSVVLMNSKRLQESMRSLEEHAKVVNPHIGHTLEQLRYRAYTFERSLLLGAAAREKLGDAALYVLLTASRCAGSLDWTIQEAAAGGARMFQLREKQLDDRALLERARKVRGWTRQAGALFIVNDRPDIARLAEADGVHLGQDDMPVKEARRIVGPDALIGVSTHNVEQLRQAIRDGASYVGVGPTFASGTKNFAELAGLDFVRQAATETNLPAFVIGGVNLETIGVAVAAGARRVAVSQAVCRADDPRAAAATLLHALS